MPVTWCYPVENGQHYCSTGFPMGCYVDKKGNPKDACVISRDYSTADRFECLGYKWPLYSFYVQLLRV